MRRSSFGASDFMRRPLPVSLVSAVLAHRLAALLTDFPKLNFPHSPASPKPGWPGYAVLALAAFPLDCPELLARAAVVKPAKPLFSAINAKLPLRVRAVFAESLTRQQLCQLSAAWADGCPHGGIDTRSASCSPVEGRAARCPPQMLVSPGQQVERDGRRTSHWRAAVCASNHGEGDPASDSARHGGRHPRAYRIFAASYFIKPSHDHRCGWRRAMAGPWMRYQYVRSSPQQ